MSFAKEVDTPIGFKKFVSEEELEEARKKRQEEWEKVRKPDDPEEAPEEPYDPRSLFEQLQDQKLKKEEEFAERQRFSNQVKGLAEDEAQFLEFVSQKQEEITRKREAEDTEVLEEYRSAVLSQAISSTSPLQNKLPTSAKSSSASKTAKKSQLSLLSAAVKRKSTEIQSPASESKKLKTASSQNSDEAEHRTEPSLTSTTETSCNNGSKPVTAQVIGILPGLGVYYDSNSSSSSDSEIELPPDIFQGGKPLLASCQDD